MSEASLRSGIAVYADQQRELLEYLCDWRSQDEFDRHFSYEIYLRPASVKRFTEGAFVLGTITGGERDWWLHLAQIMGQLGLIESKDDGGKVWYRSKQ